MVSVEPNLSVDLGFGVEKKKQLGDNNSFESCLWEKMKDTSSSGMYVDLRSEIFNSSLNIVS